MKSEYVKLSPQEKSYAQNSLLQSQLNTLNTLKHLKEYKKLREKELLFKIELKSKTSEALALLDDLDKKLPKIVAKGIQDIDDKEARTLEQELDSIKEKLKKLKLPPE